MIQRNENLKQAEKSMKWNQHKYSLIRKGRTREINEYHKALDHPLETITMATAHAEGLSLKYISNNLFAWILNCTIKDCV